MAPSSCCSALAGLGQVIEHERGYAHEHPGLVILPMVGLRKLFVWVPYARLAPVEIAPLLRMSVDDPRSQGCSKRPWIGTDKYQPAGRRIWSLCMSDG